MNKFQLMLFLEGKTHYQQKNVVSRINSKNLLLKHSKFRVFISPKSIRREFDKINRRIMLIGDCRISEEITLAGFGETKEKAQVHGRLDLSCKITHPSKQNTRMRVPSFSQSSRSFSFVNLPGLKHHLLICRESFAGFQTVRGTNR